MRVDLRKCNTKDQLSLHIALFYIWLRRSCCGDGEARQRGSPGGIRQVKVNCVSEIAPVGSAVHGRVVHVQVERDAHRRRKSAQEQRDTKQRAAEEGDCARRLYAHSPRTHCFEVDSVRAQLVWLAVLVPRRVASEFFFSFFLQKRLESSGGCWF